MGHTHKSGVVLRPVFKAGVGFWVFCDARHSRGPLPHLGPVIQEAIPPGIT